MITDCAGRCGRRVVAEPDGRAYLCRRCWGRLFALLFRVIRSAPEPTARPTTLAEKTLEEETV